MLTVNAFDHLVINVTDVDASAAWYERALGMKRIESSTSRTSMIFGRHKINLRLVNYSQEQWFTGVKPCPGSDDICFLTEFSPEAVVDHFRTCEVEIFKGPVITSGALGSLRSVYVRDPDGNLIEVASYQHDD